MRNPLIVHPGAAWSTHDVWAGLVDAWRRIGACADYRLDARLGLAHDFLAWQYERRLAEDPAAVRPTEAQVVTEAWRGLLDRLVLAGCDSLLIVTGAFTHVPLIEAARRIGVKVYLVCTESPYQLDIERTLARHVDGCWTTERTAVEALRAACPSTAYLPHAYRRGTHDVGAQPYDAQVPAHDVVFVGTYFRERLALLEGVDWTGIDLGLYGHTDQIPTDSPLRTCVRGELVDNAVSAALYRRAAVGLNLYRRTPDGCAHADSLNPRAYELAAAGCCVVSEARAEIVERFGPSVVAEVRTSAELAAAVRMLLASPETRQARGRAAQTAVASATWDARVAQMRVDVETWREVPVCAYV